MMELIVGHECLHGGGIVFEPLESNGTIVDYCQYEAYIIIFREFPLSLVMLLL